MKHLRTLALTAISVMALASCAQKVTYAQFHEKALEARKAEAGKTLTGATVTGKGTAKSNGVIIDLAGKFVLVMKDGELTFDKEKSEFKNVLGAIVIVTTVAATADEVLEDTNGNTVYHTGPLSTSYKDKDGNKGSAQYNKYGRLEKASSKGEGFDFTLTAKWTYQ